MQLVKKIDFAQLTQGSEKYPSLFDFPALSDQQKRQEFDALNKTAIRLLKAGKGPASYEEAHRVFSGWRYQMDDIMGVMPAYRRLRSDKHVQSLRGWTLALVRNKILPADYLRQFTLQFERMRNKGSGYGNPCYVFADSTMRDVLLKLKMSQNQSGHAPSSYEANINIDPKVRKICASVEGFPIDQWSDKDLLSMVEYAKSIKNGDMIFVDHDYIMVAAEKLAGE